ncbi:hypothetical protein GCM10023205_23320 [Yinghuangia aomiensis]|uniref:Uncharacterized protein n=1 Tax=Yinghuangia aomiensis TaxID=676205 RepID=A0ABP9H433_9ACTN
MGNLVKVPVNGQAHQTGSPLTADAFDVALADLLAAEAAVGDRAAHRPGVELVRLEPVLAPGAGPDLPGIRSMATALAGPGRRADTLRRVSELAFLLAGLAELGRHALVADLSELAVRHLAANPALAANPQDWVWDAAVDLADLHATACARTGRPPMRMPAPLGSPRAATAVLAGTGPAQIR